MHISQIWTFPNSFSNPDLPPPQFQSNDLTVRFPHVFSNPLLPSPPTLPWTPFDHFMFPVVSLHSLEMAKGLVTTFDPATVFTTSTTTSVSSTPISTDSSPSVTVTATPLQTSVVPTSTIPTPLAVPLTSLLKPVPLLSLDPASLAKTTYTTKLRAGNAILTGAKKYTPY